MATLKTKIEKYMGREVNFPFEVTLQDDGKGAYICEWNIKEKTKPINNPLSLDTNVSILLFFIK